MLNRIIFALGCGVIGGAANVLFLSVAGAVGLPSLFGLELPSFANAQFLYKQAFWGSLWALLFVTSIGNMSWILRGLVVAVLAACVTFFIFFPSATVDGKGPGIAGINIGLLMPVYVLLADLVFGMVASRMFEFDKKVIQEESQ